MSQNDLKKMLIFSDLPHRRVLEGIIKDQSKNTRTSESLCIERALEAALLPEHPDAQRWIRRMYLDGGSLGQAICDTVSYLAVADAHHVDVSTARTFLLFTHGLIARCGGQFHFEDHEIQYLHRQWDSVVDLLDGYDHKIAGELLEKLSDGNGGINPGIYSEMIMDNWGTTSQDARTFRFLAFLAQLLGPHMEDTPSTRLEYCRLVDQMSAAWKTP